MRKEVFVFFGVLIAAVAFSITGFAQNQGGGSSVPPPEGWKKCPRCENNKDRMEMNEKYKVEGHAFDPHDLNGVWGFAGVANAFRNPPPLTEWGKQQHAKTMSDKNAKGEPLYNKDTYKGAGAPVNCDPPGWPRLLTDNYGIEFLMLPNRVVQFFEITHTWRTIWTDGRKLPDDPPEPRWLGWNVGHWEGDTFVVESNGYDDRSWITETAGLGSDGGWTHSDEMKIVERWHRLNYGTLEVQVTLTDPKTYTQPWVTQPAKIVLVPGTELSEYYCAPSDFGAFNDRVFKKAAGEADKK
jgi:hypothetical protein